MKAIFLSIPLLLVCFCTQAFAWYGTVDAVQDATSAIIREKGTGKRVLVRFFGIACPVPAEPGQAGQPYAAEAQAMTESLLPQGLSVKVDEAKPDPVGRPTGSLITLPDSSMVQDALLKAGLAWISPDCWNCRRWQPMEKAAREARIGLWRDENPLPPWEWGK